MKKIVGAYATAPRPIHSDEQFRRYVDAVFAMPDVDGLEIPFFNAPSPWNTFEYLRAAPAAARHALTLVPAVVQAMAERPLLGLASNDEDARLAALAIGRRALEFVHEVNGGPGGDIDIVELHSAPRRADGSADALRRSLDEITAWDWGDVRLVIEHCDSETTAHPPAKGYQPLEVEVEIASAAGVGILINWGRSAIETRSAGGPVAHIQQAAAAGALTGVIFSGVCPIETVYGAAWGDFHVPIRDWSRGRLADEAATSLLTADEVERCVRAAGETSALAVLGVKVAPPAYATDDERVDLLAANVAMLAKAIATAGPGT